jgi:acyl carrier protein phosphodiesterase
VNYLAHLWLADRAGASLAGALLGDLVRGADLSALPPPLAHSVRLHRRIDGATDRHPRVAAARAEFPHGARRYAGILLDLLYDHALAASWPQHSGEALTKFAQRAGADVEAQRAWFVGTRWPDPSGAEFAELLRSYATAAGLEQAIRRTAHRLSRAAAFLDAAAGWRRHLPRAAEDLPVLLVDLRKVDVPASS